MDTKPNSVENKDPQKTIFIFQSCRDDAPSNGGVKDGAVVSASKKSLKKGTKKANRCGHPDCRKKLRVSDVKCRCGVVFCSRHRLPEEHPCGIDYKAFDQEGYIERSGLTRCAPSKVTVI